MPKKIDAGTAGPVAVLPRARSRSRAAKADLIMACGCGGGPERVPESIDECRDGRTVAVQGIVAGRVVHRPDGAERRYDPIFLMSRAT